MPEGLARFLDRRIAWRIRGKSSRWMLRKMCPRMGVPGTANSGRGKREDAPRVVVVHASTHQELQFPVVVFDVKADLLRNLAEPGTGALPQAIAGHGARGRHCIAALAAGAHLRSLRRGGQHGRRGWALVLVLIQRLHLQERTAPLWRANGDVGAVGGQRPLRVLRRASGAPSPRGSEDATGGQGLHLRRACGAVQVDAGGSVGRVLRLELLVVRRGPQHGTWRPVHRVGDVDAKRLQATLSQSASTVHRMAFFHRPERAPHPGESRGAGGSPLTSGDAGAAALHCDLRVVAIRQTGVLHCEKPGGPQAGNGLAGGQAVLAPQGAGGSEAGGGTAGLRGALRQRGHGPGGDDSGRDAPAHVPPA
mmetsp:Transcript_17289/g.52033  ORF Transcript_17289/g.52033 Transcript_17289/m.52033 type:complete len:364 (+) Transcript_17289:127-1218(+)